MNCNFNNAVYVNGTSFSGWYVKNRGNGDKIMVIFV